MFVYEYVAFSDFDGTGANPAANSAYVDAAFGGQLVPAASPALMLQLGGPRLSSRQVLVDLGHDRGHELPDQGRGQRGGTVGGGVAGPLQRLRPRRVRSSKFVLVVLVALVFGLVERHRQAHRAVVPFPVIILTLGLFTFIVDAFMLQLTEWIADPLGLSFTIDEFFWDAVLGAIIITIVSMILGWVLPDGDDD